MTKTFLVVAAATGIGQALCKKLVAQGHQVIGTYNSTEPEFIDGVQFEKVDVLEESLNFDFLPASIDGIAYCPGRIELKPFARFKESDFLEDYKLQVGGAVKSIQACLPNLKASENASIVLFSTVAVQQGFNFHSMVSSSKGAIEGFTRSLSAELAPKIRVNAVAPSLTDTNLASKLLNTDQKREANALRHPLKRIGSPEDVANAAAYLLNEESAWVTGQILAVDGGMSSIKA